MQRGKKSVCPFILLENSRPLSPPGEPQTSFSFSGTPDFLSICLGIDSFTYCGLASEKRIYEEKKSSKCEGKISIYFRQAKTETACLIKLHRKRITA